MKKTYKNPTLNVVNIKPCHLLNNSVKGIVGLDGVTKGDGDFAGGVSDGRAGRFVDDWDEDWEEDY